MFIDRNNFPETTPIQRLAPLAGNNLYIMRDDLYPLALGGNKARKGRLFLEDILKKGADYVVTYGSDSSNHCRVIAMLCAAYALPCIIISPEETRRDNGNRKIAVIAGTEKRHCPVQRVSETIEEVLQELRERGYHPYFIQGGGHGNIGTQAYVEAYEEILRAPIHFDYIFLASGTGTTQAGLVCGQLLHGVTEQKVVGISIARPNPRGKNVVVDSINAYMGTDTVTADEVHFLDDYNGGGYGVVRPEVVETIRRQLLINGIALDATYTGKAFFGMEQYLQRENVSGKNILFVHTGGTPLFFDDLGHLQ